MLLVTSRTAEADIVEGLAAGADDYLAKPLSPALLAGKIAALLRRAYPLPSGAGTEHHGGFEFDAAGATVRLDGVVIPVTAKEFALALVLFRNLERALSRTYLTDAVWGTEPGVTSRSLDMHISRVRTKLDLRPEHGFRLTPIYSYGYRLERVRVEPAA
jgi:DNA-binding response OmpR family regulator